MISNDLNLKNILKNDDINGLKLLIEEGFDKNTFLNIEEEPFLKFNPPLCSICVYYRSIKCLNYLISIKTNLKSYDQFRTPITHFAVAGGSILILNIL